MLSVRLARTIQVAQKINLGAQHGFHGHLKLQDSFVQHYSLGTNYCARMSFLLEANKKEDEGGKNGVETKGTPDKCVRHRTRWAPLRLRTSDSWGGGLTVLRV